MIYLRAHVQALEAQIAYLKERLEKAEREKREVEESARVRADALLDRLLAKNNVSPVAEPVSAKPPLDVITPFGVGGPDVEKAYKESWLREETEHIMNRDGCDEGTARAYAEQEYVAQFQVIQ